MERLFSLQKNYSISRQHSREVSQPDENLLPSHAVENTNLRTRIQCVLPRLLFSGNVHCYPCYLTTASAGSCTECSSTTMNYHCDHIFSSQVLAERAVQMRTARQRIPNHAVSFATYPILDNFNLYRIIGQINSRPRWTSDTSVNIRLAKTSSIPMAKSRMNPTCEMFGHLNHSKLVRSFVEAQFLFSESPSASCRTTIVKCYYYAFRTSGSWKALTSDFRDWSSEWRRDIKQHFRRILLQRC